MRTDATTRAHVQAPVRTCTRTRAHIVMPVAACVRAGAASPSWDRTSNHSPLAALLRREFPAPGKAAERRLFDQ